MLEQLRGTTFYYLRRRHKLRKRIRGIDKKFDRRLKVSEGVQLQSEILQWADEAYTPLAELEELESKNLLRRAIRLGIEIPQDAE
jgi:hypothetical protein